MISEMIKEIQIALQHEVYITACVVRVRKNTMVQPTESLVIYNSLLCNSAEEYYGTNKGKFGFINFKLVKTDCRTATIFGIKNHNVHDDPNEPS